MEELKYQKLFNNEWIDVKIEELKDGDIFRGVKSNGQTIKDCFGSEKLVADGDAYIDEEDRDWVVCIR